MSLAAENKMKLPKRHVRGLLLALSVFICVCLWLTPLGAAQTAPSPPSTPAGDWVGAIKIGPTEIKVGVHLQVSGTTWSGTFDQPAQGVRGLALKDVTVDGNAVHFVISVAPGSPTFDGTLAAGKITGTFKQGAAAGTFELAPGVEKKRRRPQDPVPPFPYTEIEVKVAVSPGVTLAGTVTMPAGDPPPGGWPGAVLITGSGPQDRNEEILDHRPFLVLSDALTRAGIAVLRVDDRGTAKSTGIFALSTTADFTDDAAANVAFLRAQPGVNPAKVGVIGHSEGGEIGPMLAARDEKVAFVVMLAGPGVPGREIIERQLEAISIASGTPKDVAAKARETEHAVLAAAIANDLATAKALLLQAAKEKLGPAPLTPEAEQKLQAAVSRQSAELFSPWFRYFLTLDPRVALRQVKVPVLALDGSLDTQVVAEQNLPQIETALRLAKNPDVTIKLMPGLNHLFQHARTGAPSEYADIEETISPELLTLIPYWINTRFAPKGK
jgi:pimeloyl-ACP methyl ester carboxylesterase